MPPGRSFSDGAYPRAGGGTDLTRYDTVWSLGLSPRRRGNHGGGICVQEWVGPIPAQAGEPRGWYLRAGVGRAYPRAGGGTESVHLDTGRQQGLSPRRRGNQRFRCEERRVVGPIPAQAGEPTLRDCMNRYARAYPRAGGGTSSTVHGRSSSEGLSPRRRGNRDQGPTNMTTEGPIPAQAGEPTLRDCMNRYARAYPRAGGGTAGESIPVSAALGLSPRRREPDTER